MHGKHHASQVAVVQRHDSCIVVEELENQQLALAVAVMGQHEKWLA